MPTISKEKETKEETNGAIRRPVDEIWKNCARKLSNAILSERAVNKNSKLTPWAHEFRKLHEVDGVQLERIHATLDWYCTMVKKEGVHHLGDHYIPVAESGATFRRKFGRIEAAKNKRNKVEQVNDGPGAPLKVRARIIKMTPEQQKRHDRKMGW